MNIEEVNGCQIQTMRENLKRLREQNGWSIRQLSRLSGISPAALARMESGMNFGVMNLFTLCVFYQIKPHELFCPNKDYF